MSATEAAEPTTLKGRINHSIVYWCYQNHFPSLDAMCQAAKKLGCKSIEVTTADQWKTMQKYGLTCALAPSHGFVRGLNNPKYWDECLPLLRERISALLPDAQRAQGDLFGSIGAGLALDARRKFG